MTSPGFDQSSQPAVAIHEAFGSFSRWMWRLYVWPSGDAMGTVMESGGPDSWDITHAGVDSGSFALLRPEWQVGGRGRVQALLSY